MYQVENSMSDGLCFSRTCTGNNEEWSLRVEHRFSLLRI
jgi:hypothetical protein